MNKSREEIIAEGKPEDLPYTQIDTQTREDLFEILWLQRYVDKLREFFEDVKVGLEIAEDGMEPVIYIHDIPVDPAEVTHLLNILPYESRVAAEGVEFEVARIDEKMMAEEIEKKREEAKKALIEENELIIGEDNG